MNNIFSYENFLFYHIKFNKYHYTDNRKGSPMNYIAYLKKGSARIVSENNTIELSEGDCFYIPKGLGYQSYWYSDTNIEFLSFGYLELNIKLVERYALQKLNISREIKEKIYTIPTPGNNIDCHTLSLFYNAMSDIIPSLRCDYKDRTELISDRIKNCIRQHPYCSLSDIASMCLISEPQLYNVFKKSVGITPNEFRQRVLTEAATELLQTTNKSIEEISGILNFSSSSYFRKILKKHTGKTPLEIRKSGAF